MSLRARLILSFSAVVLLTWLLALFLSFNRMREAFLGDLKSSLQDVANVLSFSVDGDQAKTFSTEADEQADPWKTMRQRLIDLKKRLPEQVRYLYVYRPLSDDQVQMVVGAEPFEWDADEEKKAEVTHFAPGDYSKSEFPRMHEGFDRPSSDDQPTYDEEYKLWSLSGYAPIYDSTGKKVAAIGLDYPANSIREKEMALLTTLGLSSVVALVAALLVSYLLAQVISRPLLKLVEATEVIAGGDLKAQVDIERKDEIGRLANSFNKMVRNLREMATALQGYTTQAVASKELEVATRLQQNLLPAGKLELPAVSVAAGLRGTDFCGGATYDYFFFGQDAYLMFVQGKVSVPGLDAAELIALCKSGLSTMVSNLIFRPQDIASALNQTVHHAAGGKANVSYLCGVYDLAQGWLTLANAGHSFPYLLRPSTGTLLQLDQESGPALGKDGKAQYADFDFKMEPGDCLIGYAPYVVDIQNPAGEAYGLGRLEQAIQKNASLDPERLQQALLDQLSAFHGKDRPLEDDLAFLVVRFAAGT